MFQGPSARYISTWTIALVLVAGPTRAAAAEPATHPETITEQRDGEAVASVRLRIIDKIENRRDTLRVPLQERVPLPRSLNAVEVRQYTPDFLLNRMADNAKEQAKENEEPDPKPVPRGEGEDNPAALIQLYREGRPVSRTWVFKHSPYLFQPPSMRYTFELLGAESPS